MDRGKGARGLQRAARARPRARPWRRWGSRSPILRHRPLGPGRSRRRPSTAVPSPTSRSSRPSAHPTAPRSSSDPSPRRPTLPGSPSSRAASRARRPLLTGIDHVNLAVPWQCFDEAVLFYSSLLGLTADASQEVPSPNGLVRSQVVRSASGACRLALNVAPLAWDTSGFPQHVAFSTDDVVAVARRAIDRGLVPLAIPQNYYDDLMARFDLTDPEVETMADARAPPRPRHRGRLHALLHRHHRRRLLRGGPEARELRRIWRPGRRRSARRPAPPRAANRPGARRHRC